VTPTSQIVGTQAFFNVLAGARYKTITNEVKLYLQGGYGKAPGTVDEKLRRQAIGSEEVIDVRPADLLKPEMASCAVKSALAKSEEDVLTYAMFPDIGRKFLEEREAGTLTPEVLLPIPEAGGVARMGGEGVPTEFVIDVHGELSRRYHRCRREG
jgi:pyruvate carboxylase subunit B